jgi:hypothetical protein
MGKYINQTSKEHMDSSFASKCKSLMEDGAKPISAPSEFSENLVCVVDNGLFAAAGYCYSQEEFIAFTRPSDSRRKSWFKWDKAEQYAH